METLTSAKSVVILGISAFYHDSAAALVVNGDIVAAAQEERFTRRKQDSRFPEQAIRYVLEESGFRPDQVTHVAFYDKPYLKFERLLETYHMFAPSGLVSFLKSVPVWIKEKLFMKQLLKKELEKLDIVPSALLFPEHHLSHAASAFYPSGFEEAAILTCDGVGEWATTTLCHGKGNRIRLLKELLFPHSLGLLYSAVTYYCGFKVNSGEYKLMGLAPYGDPNHPQTQQFKAKILDHLIDVKADGSFALNMDYFAYATGLRMTRDAKWQKLFGIPRRLPESELSLAYMNLALAIQQVTEDVLLKLAKTAKTLTGARYLVLAGGVALNCVANGKVLRSGIFDDIWIQPAASDAGGALGAALSVWHLTLNQPRILCQPDAMKWAYLGPSFTHKDVYRMCHRYGAVHRVFESFSDLTDQVAQYLGEGLVVGWFQGRMEFGPRALCNRSILGDPRLPDMQKKLNLSIKYREGFRPFAPVVLAEDIGDYFDTDRPSSYMLNVVPVLESRRCCEPEHYAQWPLYERLYHLRSDIPAVTHVDYSARLQSVSQTQNPRFWSLLTAFKRHTGCSVLVNTSFNVRGEPIVCTPEDAYRCFMNTEMDVLVIEDFVFLKSAQPPYSSFADSGSISGFSPD